MTGYKLIGCLVLMLTDANIYFKTIFRAVDPDLWDLDSKWVRHFGLHLMILE